LKALNGSQLIAVDLDGLIWGSLASAGSARHAHSAWHSTHTSTGTSTSSRTNRKAKVGVPSEYSVHKSSLVLLNGLIHGWVLLLSLLEELSVEVRVFAHALSQLRELLRLEKCGELLVHGWIRTFHAGHATSHGIGRTHILLPVIGIIVFLALAASSTGASEHGLHSVHVETFEEDGAGHIGAALRELQRHDTELTRLARDCDQSAHSVLIDTGWEATGTCGRLWLGLRLRLGLSLRNRGLSRRWLSLCLCRYLSGKSDAWLGCFGLLSVLLSWLLGSCLLGHKNDEAVLLNGVLCKGLRVVIHDLAVGDQLLSLSGMIMRLLDFGLQGSDLFHRNEQRRSVRQLSSALRVIEC